MAIMFKLTLVLIAYFTNRAGGYDFLQNYAEEAEKIVQDVVNKYDQKVLKLDNAPCVVQLKLFLNNLFNATNDDIWALRMIDAGFKLPAGLLKANVAWLGSFDECLDINSPLTKVKGKYCLTTITLDAESVLGSAQTPTGLLKSSRRSSESGNYEMPILPSFGLCIPDQCTENDLYTVLDSLLAVVPWSVTCRTADTLHPNIGDSLGAILTACFFGFFTSLMIISTVYDLLVQRRKVKPHPLLVSYSVYTNGKKLFSISKNAGEFECLNGIRVLSMMWVICYHIFFNQVYGPNDNFSDIVKFLLDGKKSAIIENATFSVDSFLVVTGMLVFYNFLKAQHRGQSFNLLEFYRHRYLRLTPPLIGLMLLAMFMTPYISNGPYYSELEFAISRPCRKSWWAVLLHVQNYGVNLSDMCITQSWYLNVDWQLYLLAPAALLLINKYPKLIMSSLCMAIIGSMAASFVISWDNELPTTNFMGDIISYNKYYYFKTHTRFSPWVIGGILGYVMAKIKFGEEKYRPKLNRIFVVIMWVITVAALVACVFGGYKTLPTAHDHQYSKALFNTFARPAWALGISWMIFACSLGYGGIINNILSWSGFQFINKMSYSIYLIHLTLLYVILYSQSSPGHFTLLGLAYSYWSVFCTSFFLAIYWVLAFEVPTVQVERYFFSGTKPKTVKNGAETKPVPDSKV